MKIFVSLLLICFSLTCLAQYDHPDYRRKNENFIKMPKDQMRNDLATFTLSGIDERIGKEPLNRVVPPVDYGGNFITFSNDDVKVHIEAGLFDPSKHKLQYYDEKYLVKIDKKPYYGEYGNVPKYSIESVTVYMGKDTIKVPAEALFDLYSPAFAYRDGSGTVRTHNRVCFSNDGHTLYIYMLNPETRGKYEVTWIIHDKKYLRRVIDTGLLQ